MEVTLELIIDRARTREVLFVSFSTSVFPPAWRKAEPPPPDGLVNTSYRSVTMFHNRRVQNVIGLAFFYQAVADMNRWKLSSFIHFFFFLN